MLLLVLFQRVNVPCFVVAPRKIAMPPYDANIMDNHLVLGEVPWLLSLEVTSRLQRNQKRERERERERERQGE